MAEIRRGVWKITLTRGRYADGRPRRVYRTVHAVDEAEAIRLKAAFIAEIDANPLPDRPGDRDLSLDQAVDRYLDHLQDEKGRAERTIRGYRQLHDQWFASEVGGRHLRHIEEANFDRLFGKMRQAGLSSSRKNQAKSLYQGLFRWAKRRRIIVRNPMVDFELPKSTYVARQRRPPEVAALPVPHRGCGGRS